MLAGVRPVRAANAPAESLARRVHRETRNTLTGSLGRRIWPSGPPPSRAKPYPSALRLRLPRAVFEGGANLAEAVRRFAPAEGVEETPISVKTLGRLLHLTNGITAPGGLPLRAAPSAGALYAGEVYVVAQNVEGLWAGVYSYHVPTHTLLRLASGSLAPRVAGAVERPATIASAPAFVLLTNVFLRYAHRYGDRAYRYALIDTGHLGENLRLAAAAEELGVASPLRFRDDVLNEMLGLDGRDEAVCALHAIGTPARAGARPVAAPLVEAARSPHFARESGLAGPEAFHAGTKLVPGAPPAMRPQIVTRATATGRLALPQRESSKATVSWAITERRSAELFRDETIALADLSFLLELAQGNAAAALAPWIELRLVAHRVAELERGVYRYTREGHRLSVIQTGDRRGAMRRACLGQEKAESAAVGFAMVADLAGASRAGDRAYRDLLIEAGAVGQRLYLAAEAIGLAARNLAAFYDGPLNGLLGVDGEREAVVHLTMVGAGS